MMGGKKDAFSQWRETCEKQAGDSPQVLAPDQQPARVISWGWVVFCGLAVTWQAWEAWAERSEYREAFHALAQCELSFWCVPAASLLKKLNKETIYLFMPLFLACEAIPPLRFLLRIAGCLMYPAMGQLLLVTESCGKYFILGIFLYIVSIFAATNHPESMYVVAGATSVALMLFRMAMGRLRNVPAGRVREAVGTLLTKEPSPRR